MLLLLLLCGNPPQFTYKLSSKSFYTYWEWEVVIKKQNGEPNTMVPVITTVWEAEAEKLQFWPSLANSQHSTLLPNIFLKKRWEFRINMKALNLTPRTTLKNRKLQQMYYLLLYMKKYIHASMYIHLSKRILFKESIIFWKQDVFNSQFWNLLKQQWTKYWTTSKHTKKTGEGMNHTRLHV